MSIRVYIADDDPLIREALEIILSNDERFKIVGKGSSGREAVEACLGGSVDIALLDIRMPVLNGIEATEQISRGSNTSVLLLSTFKEEQYIKQALEKGASGYLLKGASPDEIIQSLLLVHKGHRIFHQDVFESLKINSSLKGDLSCLSQREQEVALGISEGLSNRELSEKLFLSEGTVKNYITSILDKLQLKQRTQIAIYILTGKK